MHPVLFKIGPIVIHTYGVMVALGFIMGMWYSAREAERLGLDVNKILDLAFWVLIGGLIGARLLFIITLWKDFMHYPLEMLKVWKGGLVWYGGVIGGGLTAYYYIKKHNLPFWPVIDIISTAAFIGLAFGRLGCTSAGCCHGKVIPWADPKNPPWWALVFTDDRSLVPLSMRGKPLYPTQPLSSLCAFCLFSFLLVWRRYKKFDGELFSLALIIYSVYRFLIEFLRGDKIRGFVIPGVLSTSQFIGIFTFLAGIYFYWYLWNKNKKESGNG